MPIFLHILQADYQEQRQVEDDGQVSGPIFPLTDQLVIYHSWYLKKSNVSSTQFYSNMKYTKPYQIKNTERISFALVWSVDPYSIVIGNHDLLTYPV